MKFWIDKDDFIYLFQLMKAAGIKNDYDEIGKIIDYGRVAVNGQNVFQQRLKLVNGDIVEFRDHHVKILERDEKGEIPEKYQLTAKTRGNIRHGKTKQWESKPVGLTKKLSQQIEELSLKCHKKLLKEKITVSIAESCTGGMLQEIITRHSGSSKYFLGGVVSYSNKTKIGVLKVKESTIKKFGAVSSETAKEMISGLEKLFASDINIAITGLAGPTGGSPDKPVGTVFICLKYAGKLIEKQEQFSGNRNRIRQQSCISALKLINFEK